MPTADKNTVSTPASAPKIAGVNFTFLVIYLAGLSAFGSFVNDMFTPALPEMSRYFHCAVPTMQLGLTMGMIGLGLGQFVLGPFSFKYGRKPVLLFSVVLFIVAAIASIFSPTIHLFLACRLLQGIGGSGGYFLARTIPADVYGGRQLAKCMAVMGAINGFAPACAPVVGGLVAEHLGWKPIFVVLTVFALILLCISPRLKETLPRANRPTGSVWGNFRNYPRLLRNKPFMIHALFKGSALGLLFAYISASPFIFQDHYGWSELDYGLFIGFNAIFVAAGSMVSLRFRQLKNAAFVGAIILLATAVVEAVVLFFVDNFWVYEFMLIPLVFSLGMIFAVTNTLSMNEGRAEAGAASALLGIVGYIYGAICAPLVGMGDIMRSFAIVMLALAAITFLFAIRARRLPADLDA